MTSPSVSVVVVSRHRPEELRKCLLALKLQTAMDFEVVLVGDAGISRVISELMLTDRVKFSEFDIPNISRARNIGISLAAGDVVAFIDDDAVAEPTWLKRLTAPFKQGEVAAAGGFVRGRNGISYQWKAEAIGQTGDSEPIDVARTTLLERTEYRAIKTQGTNCAFRRDVLVRLGGFDESYHFYMDETDLNVRIGQAGLLTAIVPDAEVQHGYAKSARRTQNRAPRSLFDIGASRAYFLKKFGQDIGRIDRYRAHQRDRLCRLMVRGELEPGAVKSLIETYDDGVMDGLKRESITANIPKKVGKLLPFLLAQNSGHQVIFGRRRLQKRLFATACDHISRNAAVTVMVFSRTALFHRRWFHRDGYWVQSGGLYGRSDRSDPIYKRYSTRARAERECQMLSKTRDIVDAPKRPQR
ncbi:glycosyltransferase [uncultured Litoreibacter sp.]|uniref:glycosyltransferase family 2 protein n=1 Tax=uncultured Litoreibacter sp. TaxID=1392394 RepID=UPI00261B7438|nr:glycosyltransferase [uncultured Litoreibacter sp.]